MSEVAAAAGYDAFISYSRRVDRALAQGLEGAIERIGRPWYRWRVSSVFRDDSELSADPDLWGTIQAALRGSRQLILLASPEAASSRWIEREVSTWRESAGDVAPILVLTGGDLVWDAATGDFDHGRSPSLPPCLFGAFATEPRFIDGRGFTGRSDPPTLNDPRFRDLAAQIAATVRGTTREAVLGEAQRHRRTLRTIVAAVLVALSVTSVAAVIFAIRESRQAGISQARALAAEAESRLAAEPEEALARALRSLETAETREGRDALDAAYLATQVIASSPVHAGPVVFAAGSPDGRRIASAGEDGEIHVWGAERDDAPIRHRHPGRLAGIGFTPGGRVISAGADAASAGAVLEWPAARAGPPRRLLRSPVPITSLAIAGGRLVVADAAGRVMSRRLAGGPTRVRRPRTAPVQDVVITPGGIVSADVDGAIRCLAGPRLRTTCAHRAPGPLLAVRAGAGRVVAASSDGRITVWDRGPRSGPRSWDAETSLLRAVDVAPDGRAMVTGGSTGARLWDVGSGRLIHELAGHQGVVFAVAFSADGRRVITGGDDGRAIVWDRRTGGRIANLLGHDSSIRAVGLTGGLAMTGSVDRTARTWDVADGAPEIAIGGTGGAIVSLATPRGRLAPLLATDIDGAGRIWRGEPRGPATATAGHGAPVLVGAVSADGRAAATGAANGVVRIWPAPPAAPARITLDAPAAGLAFLADDTLVTGSDAGTLALWNADGTPARPDTAQHPGGIRTLTTTAAGDDRRILTGGFDGAVAVWSDDLTLRARMTGHAAEIVAIDADPTGRRVVTASADGTARVWSLRTGAEAVLRGHESEVLDAAFLDAARVVTAGQDGTVRLWRADDGRLLRTASGHLGPVFEVTISGDGRRIASASGDGEARLWDAGDLRLLAVLRGAAGQLNAVALDAAGGRIATAGNDGVLRVYRCSRCDDLGARAAAAARILERVRRAGSRTVAPSPAEFRPAGRG